LVTPEKTMLVIDAGGYSTRLGYPKYQLQTTNGNYLFENLIENIPCDFLVILTNKSNIFWWTKWRIERSIRFNKPVNVLVEPHDKPENAFGPLRYLTSNVPIMFGKQANNVIIVPVDSYYSNFVFVKNLLKRKHAFVISQYPKELLGQMGVFRLDWKGNVVSFIEKPKLLDEDNLLSKYWVFTGMLKTTTDALLQMQARDKSLNLGWIVQNLISKNFKPKAIKCKCIFRDVGIPQTYEELIKDGILLDKAKG
jgi:NDP-sugar pyrophosphorylase family protein